MNSPYEENDQKFEFIYFNQVSVMVGTSSQQQQQLTISAQQQQNTQPQQITPGGTQQVQHSRNLLVAKN